jgi:periplasmic divalent cation tolerance protein
MNSTDPSDGVVVLVTVGSRPEGERIAETLVTERLAACVNLIGPLQSVYRWEGQVQRDEELLLLIKTRRALCARVEARVKVLHSYQNPEVIAVPITAGSAAYLDWLRGATDE